MGALVDAPQTGDEAVEEVVVEGQRWSPDDSAAAVTVVPVDERLPASADVATAVQRAPGTVVKRLGGLGDWSSVSIRGSTARQVEVFLDGVPLNPEGSSVTNLSELPLRAFDAVHVYRGAAPLHLDTTAVGGAVDLVTAERTGVRAAVGWGAWNTGRVSVVGSGPAGPSDVFLALDGLSTDGDFPWFDDGGTRTDAADDRFVVRSNNGTEQLALHARWRGGSDRVRWTLLDAWVHREEGVPGPVFDPWSGVAYAVDRHVPTAQLDVRGEDADAQVRAWGLVRDEQLFDPARELTTVGDGDLTRTQTASLGLRVQGRALLGPVKGTVMAAGRSDRLDGRAVRQVGRAGVEASGGLGPLTATGTARVLATDGAVRAIPRGGVRVERGAAHAKASVGRSVRIPDLTELYGDRGALVGNPELRDERGTTLDGSAGITWATGQAEAGGFYQVVDDRIVWTRNAQGVALPVNLSRTRSAGAEAAVGWAPGWLRLDSTATFTRAVDISGDPTYDGNQLPGVPWVEWFHRSGVDARWVRAAHDLSLTAGTFADPANWDLQPPRWLHGATLSVHDRADAWSLSLDVRNLFDRRVQLSPRDPLVDDGQLAPEPIVDFTGYPLAGRTWMLQLRWQATAPRTRASDR